MNDKEWIKEIIEEWMNNREWVKERIKEWIFGILVGLGFFSLYMIACLTNAGVI